ncbi:MAG TPA: hypothetical protein VNW92_29385 [Polyangiaceae bacterium]|nr:hypothetical protein [Polyangiaceae bacterium]
MNELASNLHFGSARRRACLVLSCLLVSGCVSGSDGPSASNRGDSAGADGGSGSSNAQGGGAQGGAFATSGSSAAGSMNATGGFNSTAGTGAASSLGGSGTTAGGAGPNGGGGGAAGAGTGPADVAVASHPVSVSSGKVFNVADDFFNDGFIPPSPLANFGFHAPIIPLQRADGGLDVAWIDYSGGKGAPMELPAVGMINVTHIDPGLTTGTTVATGIQSYRLLGFTVDPSGNFYIAYNADHPFKNSISGDANNVNGNELRIAKSNGASFDTKAWDSLVFGDQDNTKDKSKGNAGAAGSGVLGFDTVNQKLVIYVAHQMAWGDNGTRHQAGFFAYFDPGTGKELAPGGSLPLNTGAGWFYSHDFDQRLLIDNGTSYLLGHGDAFPRQLGLASFNLSGYTNDNASTFDQSYFAIDGNEGDNNTNAETGQFIKLSDGSFAMVHTSSQGRSARDVHVVLASSTGVKTTDAWLTSNTGNIQATMPKLEILNQELWLSYGLWDSTNRTNKTINWYSLLVDMSLKPASQVLAISGVEFVAASPLLKFASGPNAGNVAWVSGNSAHTLTVNVASVVR